MKKILKILEKDATMTPEQIATQLGMSVDEVKREISILEDQKIILRKKAVINWPKAGREVVSAVVEVKVSPQRGVGFDAIAERIYRFPEARSVFLVSGTYDLAVIVEGKTMKDVANFVAQKLAPLEQVQGTITHFIMKKYKEDGDIFEEKEEVERLPVSP